MPGPRLPTPDAALVLTSFPWRYNGSPAQGFPAMVIPPFRRGDVRELRSRDRSTGVSRFRRRHRPFIPQSGATAGVAQCVALAY